MRMAPSGCAVCGGQLLPHHCGGVCNGCRLRAQVRICPENNGTCSDGLPVYLTPKGVCTCIKQDDHTLRPMRTHFNPIKQKFLAWLMVQQPRGTWELQPTETGWIARNSNLRDVGGAVRCEVEWERGHALLHLTGEMWMHSGLARNTVSTTLTEKEKVWIRV
jgi:hypothetical protein